MTSRLRLLGMTVASVALLGSAVAVACADEVKGPVHITSRGVETIDRYDPERMGRRTAVISPGTREADRARHDAERERAREMAEALREAARDKAEIAREAAEEAREALREAGLDRDEAIREVTRAARDAAREVARNAREIAKAARDAARDALREAQHAQTIVLTAPDFSVPIEKAMVVMRTMHHAMAEPLASAGDGLDRAEADLTRQAASLAAMQSGDFSDVVVVRDGVTKCGDVSKHANCQPLTDTDRAELVVTVAAALGQARDGIDQAREGLRAAQQAMNGQTVP